jgi:dsRNA-specific ribonuclease
MIEALIGCYYYDCGESIAFEFLQSIDLIPNQFILDEMIFKEISMFVSQEIFSKLVHYWMIQFHKTLALSNTTLLSSQQSLLPFQFQHDLSTKLEYSFTYPALLDMAFLHRSKSSIWNYEALEFLGDAILDSIVVDHIYEKHHHDDWQEGEMSSAKTQRTNNRYLAKYTEQLQLMDYLNHESFAINSNKFLWYEKMTKMNEESVNDDDDNDNKKDNIYHKIHADLFEALIGAIYLDCGGNRTRVLQVLHHIQFDLEF